MQRKLAAALHVARCTQHAGNHENRTEYNRSNNKVSENDTNKRWKYQYMAERKSKTKARKEKSSPRRHTTARKKERKNEGSETPEKSDAHWYNLRCKTRNSRQREGKGGERRGASGRWRLAQQKHAKTIFAQSILQQSFRAKKLTKRHSKSCDKFAWCWKRGGGWLEHWWCCLKADNRQCESTPASMQRYDKLALPFAKRQLEMHSTIERPNPNCHARPAMSPLKFNEPCNLRATNWLAVKYLCTGTDSDSDNKMACNLWKPN